MDGSVLGAAFLGGVIVVLAPGPAVVALIAIGALQGRLCQNSAAQSTGDCSEAPCGSGRWR